MDQTQAWRIRVPTDRLSELRDDEAFRQLLALGRFLNSVRFCQYAMIHWATEDSVVSQRQRSAVFFIAAGLLHEGLQLLQRMAKHFRGFGAWADKVHPILSDRAVEQLLSASIILVRNQTVFHFGEDAYIDPLTHLNHKTLVLVSGVGPQQGQVYYELADLLAYHLFIGGPAPTADEHLARARSLMERTVDLMNQLSTAGEALISEYCAANGLIAELRTADGSWRAA
jgi:hypothetical protein